MIHLANISWVQLILIGLGAVLQFIALCAFVRETSAYRPRKRARKEVVHVQEQGLISHSRDEVESAPADEMDEEHSAEGAHPEPQAGNATGTAKVKFVQSLEFLPDSHYARQKVISKRLG